MLLLLSSSTDASHPYAQKEKKCQKKLLVLHRLGTCNEIAVSLDRYMHFVKDEHCMESANYCALELSNRHLFREKQSWYGLDHVIKTISSGRMAL